jgi:predicted 3-demethylubiquinone-9 3-methyltransferase (glyoxalase superfamily)
LNHSIHQSGEARHGKCVRLYLVQPGRGGDGEVLQIVFKGAKVGKVAYWGKNPMGIKEGSVLTAHLTILWQKIMLLNGFMEMPFNESMSIVVPCKTQQEIDTYWKKLTAVVASLCSAVG